MIAALGLSLLVSTATGALLLRLYWPRSAGPCSWPLALALGAGLGLGLASVLLFCWMLVLGPTRGFVAAEATLAGVLVIAGLRRTPGRTMPSSASLVGSVRFPWRGVVTIGFVVAAAAAVAAFASILRQQPHGEWDAWMNWDMRARMIFRGGPDWRAAFSATFPWSHPDYPLLLPSLVVRTWLYAGETLLGPALVAGTFTFGTVALLAVALAELRSTSQGLLAGLMLLSTPFFVLHGTSFYADVPLAFFFLATIVCLALDERYGSETWRFAVLAGVAAGFAMWTKNEGLLFTLTLVAGLLLASVRRNRYARKRLIAFAAGLLPLVVLVAGFKIAFAPPNDLLSTLAVERTLDRLTALDRYLVTAREYVSHIALFGSNDIGSAIWVLLACLLGFGVQRFEWERQWVAAVAAGLGLMLAGHFMVFVSMADELPRLLASSLDRLLLQLWPAALFLFFTVIRTPEEAIAGRRYVEHTRKRQVETGIPA